MIDVSGVRSSCDVVARKSFLARFCLLEGAVHSREPIVQLSELTHAALEIRLADQVEVEDGDPAQADVGTAALFVVGDFTVRISRKNSDTTCMAPITMPLRQANLHCRWPMQKAFFRICEVVGARKETARPSLEGELQPRDLRPPPPVKATAASGCRGICS